MQISMSLESSLFVFWVSQIYWRRNQVKVEKLQTSEIENGYARTCTRRYA